MVDVEYWGVLDNLKLILDWNYEKILIQTNSLKTVNAIQVESFEGSKRIHRLLKSVRYWKIQCIPHDENKIVDTLIKMIRDKRIRSIEDSLSKKLI